MVAEFVYWAVAAQSEEEAAYKPQLQQIGRTMHHRKILSLTQAGVDKEWDME